MAQESQFILEAVSQEKAVLMGANCGNLNIYNGNFQMRGYNGCLTADNGSNIKVVSSNFNSHSSRFSTGSNNMSLIGTIADYTNEEKNSFKQWPKSISLKPERSIKK